MCCSVGRLRGRCFALGVCRLLRALLLHLLLCLIVVFFLAFGFGLFIFILWQSVQVLVMPLDVLLCFLNFSRGFDVLQCWQVAWSLLCIGCVPFITCVIASSFVLQCLFMRLSRVRKLVFVIVVNFWLMCPSDAYSMFL